MYINHQILLIVKKSNIAETTAKVCSFTKKGKRTSSSAFYCKFCDVLTKAFPDETIFPYFPTIKQTTNSSLLSIISKICEKILCKHIERFPIRFYH